MPVSSLRSAQLEDLTFRSGGDGRTVEAFAAVFDRPVPIADHEGRYREQIHRAAFNDSLAKRGANIPIFFNHGLDLYGKPVGEFTKPLGVAVEPPRVERVGEVWGLLTVTRYDSKGLGGEVLDMLKSGSVRGYSFSALFSASDPTRPRRGGYQPGKDGELTLVTRMRGDLHEYGPTPLPAYQEAAVHTIRAANDPVDGSLLTQAMGWFTAIDSIADQASEALAAYLEAPLVEECECDDMAGEPADTTDSGTASDMPGRSRTIPSPQEPPGDGPVRLAGSPSHLSLRLRARQIGALS